MVEAGGGGAQGTGSTGGIPRRGGGCAPPCGPRVADQGGTVCEHGARALDRSLPLGSHGLPLMGTGDWNDGMNRVGAEGKGESVWLGWFLHTILRAWATLADGRGEGRRAGAWR